MWYGLTCNKRKHSRRYATWYRLSIRPLLGLASTSHFFWLERPPRLRLIWARKYESFLEWCENEPDELFLVRRVTGCMDGLFWLRFMVNMMRRPWLWAALGDHRRQDRDLVGLQLFNLSPEQQGNWFAEVLLERIAQQSDFRNPDFWKLYGRGHGKCCAATPSANLCTAGTGPELTNICRGTILLLIHGFAESATRGSETGLGLQRVFTMGDHNGASFWALHGYMALGKTNINYQKILLTSGK